MSNTDLSAKELAIKEVMNNFLIKIAPIEIELGKNIEFFESRYQTELDINGNLSMLYSYEILSKKNFLLKLNSTINFINCNLPKSSSLVNFYHAKLFTFIKNYNSAIDFYNIFLKTFPMTQEALFGLCQLELQKGNLKEALGLISHWNKSHFSIYQVLEDNVNFNTPIYIYSPNSKFKIISYQNNYYLEPIDDRYYGLRFFGGDAYLIPKNFFFKFLLIPLLKLLRKKKVNFNTGPIARKKFIAYFGFKLIKKILFFIVKYFLNITILQPYKSAEEAIKVAN